MGRRDSGIISPTLVPAMNAGSACCATASRLSALSDIAPIRECSGTARMRSCLLRRFQARSRSGGSVRCRTRRSRKDTPTGGSPENNVHHHRRRCGFERAKRLRKELTDYWETGATVVIIGQGEPEQAAAYAEQEDLKLPILTDRDRSVYRAYGLLEATQPQVLFDAPQWLWSQSSETAEAFTSARRKSGRPLVNSPWQLPGEFVIGTDGEIRHAHRFQYCEDFPDPRTHLTALKGGAVVEG